MRTFVLFFTVTDGFFSFPSYLKDVAESVTVHLLISDFSGLSGFSGFSVGAGVILKVVVT